MVIVVLLGKSGTGKTTLETQLSRLGFNRIISYTTRKPRPGEIDGVHYNFVDENQFKQLIKNNILMEWAIHANNYYGSPRPVGHSQHVIVMETEGLEQIKKIYGKQVISVYVETPGNIANERATDRLGEVTTEDLMELNIRNKDEDEKFNHIEDKIDLIVDGSTLVKVNAINILKLVRDEKERRGLN